METSTDNATKMNTDGTKTIGSELEEYQVPVKLKLSALWIVVMFIYVYVDIFGFYEPGSIESILDGKVWDFDITQAWAFSALVLMTIPSLMIFLSLALKADWNRKLNIGVGVVYILVSLGNAVGETWAYLIAGSIIEAILLGLVVWYAWSWPVAPAQGIPE